MALINCPECGYDTLSENAYVCPCCGGYVNDSLNPNQMHKKSKEEYKVLYIFSLLIFPIGLLAFVVLSAKEDWYRKAVANHCIFLSVIAPLCAAIIYLVFIAITIIANCG